MTIKTHALAAAVLSLVFASSCDKAADQQQKANEAQAKANEKIADVAGEAEQKIKNAQAEADKKIAEAQAAFMKMREDYRHSTTEAMVDFDKKVSDLEAKATKSKAKAKTDLELKVKQLKAGRESFMAEYKNLETASAVTWDETKAKLDKQWNELKAAVD
jgi:hypothetical protein